MTDHLGRRPIYVAEPSRQCFHDLPNSSVSAVSRIGDRYRELLTLGHRVRRQIPARTGLLREHRTQAQAQQSYNPGVTTSNSGNAFLIKPFFLLVPFASRGLAERYLRVKSH